LHFFSFYKYLFFFFYWHVFFSFLGYLRGA
jgi:hypothetical protein